MPSLPEELRGVEPLAGLLLGSPPAPAWDVPAWPDHTNGRGRWRRLEDSSTGYDGIVVS